MNEEQMSCQTLLDALISQDSLQIIKAAIPYMPLKSQQFLSIYAKVKELSNTISFFHHTQPELSMMSASSVQPEEILNDMRKYLSDRSTFICTEYHSAHTDVSGKSYRR